MSAQTTEIAKKRSGGKVKGFFKGVLSELKKVHWPSKKQLITYTGVVVVAVLAMSLAVSAFDLVINFLLELIMKIA